MLVAGNDPRLERVALRAVTAEPLEMRVLAIVASGAVEGLARGARVELIGASNAQPRLQRLERGGAVGVTFETRAQVSVRRSWRAPRGPSTRGRMFVGLMLDVTCRTLLDARVERGRLTTEQSLGVRMAGRALGDRHADGRLVARRASVAEVCVPRRQRTRTDELLQRR